MGRTRSSLTSGRCFKDTGDDVCVAIEGRAGDWPELALDAHPVRAGTTTQVQHERSKVVFEGNTR